MSEAKYKRALEIMTTLNERTVTVHMVREMAQRVLDEAEIIKKHEFEVIFKPNFCSGKPECICSMCNLKKLQLWQN